MILRSKHLLLELLLAICVCCHLAAPLGNIDRLIEAKLKPRHLEGLTDSSSANAPIKVLRSTDHDIIIQIRRSSPFKQSSHEGIEDDKDVLDLSDDSMHNKHKKSKLKSVEDHEHDTNDSTFVGKYIVSDRISRLSMHKLPSNLKPFESKEFRWKDKNDRRLLEETEHKKTYQEGNSPSDTTPSNFEEYINKDVILDMEVMKANPEDNGFVVESSYSNKSHKYLGQINQSDEENKENQMESRDFFDNRRSREGFPSKLSLDDRKNKRELNERSSDVSERKSSWNGIDLNMKRTHNFEGSREESVVRVLSANKEPDSMKIPNSPNIAFRTISVKMNDIAETQKPESATKTTTIIQDIIKNTLLNEGQNKLLLDPKAPLRDKVIKIRSPALDSLQDLKRKFKIEHKTLPLLPRPSVLLPRKETRPQTYGAPPKQAPPNGQYYLPQRPRPTEDPIAQAERTKTALQRMILFVNAMGKFDYYVSNAARNFVDLLTHHTHEYDQTVRSRFSGKDQCGGEKDKRDENDDDDDDNGDNGDRKAGYVRIRTSKTKRSSHERGQRANSRNRNGPYSGSGEYGW